MQVILFDTPGARQSLFPFTAIRPIADIRTGIFTIREWWQRKLNTQALVLTEDYLGESLSGLQESKLYVNASCMPDNSLFDTIAGLQPGQAIFHQQHIIAVHTTQQLHFGFTIPDCTGIHMQEWGKAASFLSHPLEIMQWNNHTLARDFELVTAAGASHPLSSTNRITAAENIFVEEGAIAEHCFINASGGPVYIGKNALIMEGAMIRGPFTMLEGSVVKMGAKIYGATTVGKYCTVGGEIKNTVFFDYSNKAHDGYLGDAVIGSWCNLGAGTSCSNIKNNAGEVKIWNPSLHKWTEAGTKCGVLMGDYSRTAINTSLNTGTVTGVCAHIVSEGFPPKYIESFTWDIGTKEKYVLEKAVRDIDNWKQLKKQRISEKEISILEHLYQNQL